MGIGITLQVKEKYVGKKSLVHCTNSELKLIINELRRTYAKRNNNSKKSTSKINNLLVEKNKHELKSTQLRGVLNTIMGLVESAITHEELQGEVVRDISRLLDRRYDLINEEIR